MPTVRRLSPPERDAALDTVVAAFVTDPILRWWFPDDATYPELAHRFFGVLLDTRLEGGEVWVVEDGGDVAAVSMWVPPGGSLLGPEVASARYDEVVEGFPAPSAERIGASDEVVDALLPVEPHWYLGVLAVHPAHRGSGFGTRVCEPVFAAADRAGVTVVLETANAANVGYYQRRGFSVLHEAALACADDGTAPEESAPPAGEPLTVRVMLRAPRKGA